VLNVGDVDRALLLLSDRPVRLVPHEELSALTPPASELIDMTRGGRGVGRFRKARAQRRPHGLRHACGPDLAQVS